MNSNDTETLKKITTMSRVGDVTISNTNNRIKAETFIVSLSTGQSDWAISLNDAVNNLFNKVQLCGVSGNIESAKECKVLDTTSQAAADAIGHLKCFITGVCLKTEDREEIIEIIKALSWGIYEMQEEHLKQ